MTPGADLTPFIIERVSPEPMKAWAVFLADPNPIHLDPEAVKALGLGDRVINQGPANLAYVINCLMQNFPGWRIGSIESRFTGNVFAGDRVVATGKVITIDDETANCEAWLDVVGRGPVIVCSATLHR